MDTIRVESTGAVTRVTLDRPDVRNAFNDSVVLELTEAFEKLPDTTSSLVETNENKNPNRNENQDKMKIKVGVIMNIKIFGTHSSWKYRRKGQVGI